MITFFTTVKNFTGKNLINQVNAIKSWVIGNRYNCEAIIFKKSQGIEVLSDLPNIVYCEDILTNENGLPFINGMFYKASDLAKNNIVCFLNADIIINDDFIEMIVDIHKKTRKNYLVVGQRLNTSFDFLIDFNNQNWYSELMNTIKSNSGLQLPYG